jgi:Domain of unknown function (DUF4397)
MRGVMRQGATMARMMALGALVWLAGCGGGEDPSKAQLRLVNASSGYAELDLVVDDKRLQSAVRYGSTDRYAEVDPSETATEVTRTGSPAALATARPALRKGDRYTLVAYGGEGALRTALLDDNSDEPDSGKARLRVLNGSADADELDVYLTADGVDLVDAEPLAAAAKVGVVGPYSTVDAATWRLRITAAGDREDLRLDLAGIVLASRQRATLVITSGAGGVLMNALLVTERGAIAALGGTQARVRAVAAVADSGAVAATVGEVSLMNGSGAPAVGRYRLVPAGEAIGSVTVNGLTVAVPAKTLAVGTDHTLLVWGPSGPSEDPARSRATAAWIEDDNRAPAVSGRAKLRLLHGVAGLEVPIAMTLDFTPVADGVAGGMASTPSLVLATTLGTLTVTAPGRDAPLFTAEDQTLAAGGVYTVFAVGAQASPSVFLRKDR